MLHYIELSLKLFVLIIIKLFKMIL